MSNVPPLFRICFTLAPFRGQPTLFFPLSTYIIILFYDFFTLRSTLYLPSTLSQQESSVVEFPPFQVPLLRQVKAPVQEEFVPPPGSSDLSSIIIILYFLPPLRYHHYQPPSPVVNRVPRASLALAVRSRAAIVPPDWTWTCDDRLRTTSVLQIAQTSNDILAR